MTKFDTALEAYRNDGAGWSPARAARVFAAIETGTAARRARARMMTAAMSALAVGASMLFAMHAWSSPSYPSAESQPVAQELVAVGDGGRMAD